MSVKRSDFYPGYVEDVVVEKYFPEKVQALKGIKFEAYTWPAQKHPGEFCTAVFSGKKNRPLDNQVHRHPSYESAVQYCQRLGERELQEYSRKVEDRADRKRREDIVFANINNGDIFFMEDEGDYNFYQVVGKKGRKTVGVQLLRTQNNSDSRWSPVPDEFVAGIEPIDTKITLDGNLNTGTGFMRRCSRPITSKEEK